MRSSLFFLMVLAVFAVKSVYTVEYGHEQCRQHGYVGACNYNGISVVRRDERCQNFKCASQISGNTYRYKGIGPAAIGTKCGPNHICNIENRCVADSNAERSHYLNCS